MKITNKELPRSFWNPINLKETLHDNVQSSLEF